MLKPAIHSTDEPPVDIVDVALQEYVNNLRRRIEVQLCQMETLADQVNEARKARNTMIELFYRNVRQLQADLQNLDSSNGPGKHSQRQQGK
jgi:hypothetical protein